MSSERPIRIVAAAMIALLEEPITLHRDVLRARLFVNSWTFMRALAEARAAGYVDLADRQVTITAKARQVLADGRKAMAADASGR